MSLSDIREERIGQVSAIEITLATAPDIQEDLKAKFGYGENIFFYNDLVEYRIKNKLEDIAEDLDVKSRYSLISDEVARVSVGYAFRGHHDEEFIPEYQFEGLFGKITNDMIEGIRASINGRKAYELGEGIHAQTPEERSELGRKGNEAQGNYSWSLEEIAEIGELKYGEGLTWNDTTSEMNEKYDKDFTTNQVTLAYRQNKDKLPDEEE